MMTVWLKTLLLAFGGLGLLWKIFLRRGGAPGMEGSR
jgi:hypothetical protein